MALQDMPQVDESDQYAMDLEHPIDKRGEEQEIDAVALEGERPLPLNRQATETDHPQTNQAQGQTDYQASQ